MVIVNDINEHHMRVKLIIPWLIFVRRKTKFIFFNAKNFYLTKNLKKNPRIYLFNLHFSRHGSNSCDEERKLFKNVSGLGMCNRIFICKLKYLNKKNQETRKMWKNSWKEMREREKWWKENDWAKNIELSFKLH